MSRPSVVMLTSVHDSPFDIRVFHKEAKTLSNNGYDVTLIAQHHTSETVDGVKIIAVPKQHRRIRRMLWTTSQIARRAWKLKPDAYHLHNPEMLPAGLVIRFLTRREVVYDVHESFAKSIISKDWIPPLLRQPIAFCFNIFERVASRLVSWNIAATATIAADLPEHNTTVITNYPFKKLARIRAGRRRHGTCGCVMIYGGVLSEARGVGQLVRSLKYVDSNFDVKLALIGRFDSSLFEKKIRNLDLFSRVVLSYWIPFDKLINKYKDVDIGMIVFQPTPNHVNAMPNKLFEYMALGLPVIASDFSLWQRIIEDNKCGICVDPTSPREIAKAIETLCAQPELRKQMGENGRKAIIREYNWEQESTKLLLLYKHLLPRAHTL